MIDEKWRLETRSATLAQIEPSTYISLPGFQKVFGLALSTSNQALRAVDGDRAELRPLLVESGSVAERIRCRSRWSVLDASDLSFETAFEVRGC